jgi:hypothetical protein
MRACRCCVGGQGVSDSTVLRNDLSVNSAIGEDASLRKCLPWLSLTEFVSVSARWSYSPETDIFTWLHGSSQPTAQLAAQESLYPTQLGVPSASALPLPRQVCRCFTNVQDCVYARIAH